MADVEGAVEKEDTPRQTLENGEEEPQINLELGQLDLTSQDDYFLDEVDVHIQENLEDELVQEALKTGVDLRQYSRQIQRELCVVENSSIQDYLIYKDIKESENIASLHYQIASCDSLLERMEQMLSSFQTDLRSISTEIQTLQEQSMSMNIKLKNRQSVRSELSQFVDEMVVSDYLIKHICETSVVERAFIECLHELAHKINFLKEQMFRDTLACEDVKDVIEKLRVKAVSKCRDYLLGKIYQFRKPMANYQVPQDTLLRYRYFNEFLMSNHRQVATEVRDVYLETMSKIYYCYFRGYITKLLKLPVRHRICVLTTELNDPIIVPHTAGKGDKKHSLENIFRSVQFALADNCCREYQFVVDFFNASGSRAQDLFTSILGKTLHLYLKYTDMYLEGCYDGIGVLLCLHLAYRYQEMMEKKNIPCLEKYWNSLLANIWPKFAHIMELNIQSIRDIDPQKVNNIDIRPHYVARRYTDFCQAILTINEFHADEKAMKLMGQLQMEVENFILRMAAEFQHRKEQLIFLINNYDHMMTVNLDRVNDDGSHHESFQQTLNARIQEFVEEILQPNFGGMINFVKETENAIEHGNKVHVDERRIKTLIQSFNAEWKKAIDNIDHDVMQSFTNFKNGTSILQAVLTQLIQYYHRFQKILNQSPFKNLTCRNEIINIHNVMVEIKKHKTSL
ncbi:Vacuolar protein sorting-associated protein 52-like protein [Trichoplax sp. H2]|nr:Vacuolar protein sorting-associated protein 52-like protein [Trichoplax sp. H2]|eukprot:RDD45399.1 Vacuolar protein sorting-associated protein 52-like protein [Trichoplax sp. H2]